MLRFIVALLLPFALASAAFADGPNVVFVLIDDLGYGDIGCFRSLGNPTQESPDNAHYPPTPHLDRLAEQGVRLTQFYVAAPICSPSRAGITTGRYPARSYINSYLNDRASNRKHGMRDWLDPAGNCLAKVFQNAGYATAHVGKWHLGGGRDVGDAPLPKEYGFDESLTSFEGLGDRILPPGNLSKQSAELGRGEIRNVAKHEMTKLYVDRCVDFIDRHKTEQFFLQLWLDDVHDGHVPAPGEAEKFADITDNPNERKFFAVLTEMDRQLGRLFDHIDERGLAKETLICVTGDNGPTAWPRYYQDGHDPAGSTAGFRGRKWSLYEGGVRMPFIARWSGRIEAGRIDRQTLFGGVDLLPTLAGVAGLASALENLPHALDGEDIGVFGTKSKARTRPLFWEYGRAEFYLWPGLQQDVSPNLAMRTSRWKLLANDDGSRAELYAVGPDGEIDEFQNVAENHPDVARELLNQLLDWRRSLPVLDVN